MWWDMLYMKFRIITQELTITIFHIHHYEFELLDHFSLIHDRKKIYPNIYFFSIEKEDTIEKLGKKDTSMTNCL